MRTKAAAIAGSAGFLVVAPGVVAGLVPWWLTGWQQGADWPVPVRVAGGLLITAGAASAGRVCHAAESTWMRGGSGGSPG